MSPRFRTIFDLAEKSGRQSPAFLFPGAHGPGPGGGSDLARAAGGASHGDRPGSERERPWRCRSPARPSTLAWPGRERATQGGCLAGKSFVFVSRKGDVYPCGYFPLRVGNIREKNFIEIWENSPELRALRERDLKGKCGRCSFSRGLRRLPGAGLCQDGRLSWDRTRLAAWRCSHGRDRSQAAGRWCKTAFP